MSAYHSPLTMLHIVSDAPAAALINGTPAGRADGEGCGLPISGEALLQVFPLGAGMPVSAYISTEPPRMSSDGHMRLFSLPGGVLLARARMSSDLSAGLPHILKTVGFAHNGRSLRASIYYDRVYGLAIEENGSVIFAHAFLSKPVEPLIEIFSSPNGTLIAAGGGPAAVISLIQKPALVASFENARLLRADGGVDVYERVEGLENAEAKHSYTLSGDGVSDAVSAVCINAQYPAHALVCAARQNDRAGAEALLSPSLKKDVAFEDIRAFFGDFNCALPTDDGTLLLAYPPIDGVCPVRSFIFVTADGQIRDISEK